MRLYSFHHPSVNMRGQRSVALNCAQGRAIFLCCVFAVAFFVVSVRVIDLGVLQSFYAPDSGHSNSVSRIEKTSKNAKARADITDRNGVILATTIKVPSLFVDPLLVDDPKDVATKLQKIFPDKSYDFIFKKITAKNRYGLIGRDITPQQQYAILKIGCPGLGFSYEARRIYPQGALMSHMVGYTDVDNKGLSGAERAFDADLNTRTQPLTLSLDMRLQYALKRELTAAMQRHMGVGAAGAIVDVKTGELLAGVSLPDFDPQKPGNAKTIEGFNRLTLGIYELGSIFKVFSTAAFIENNPAPLEQAFDAREPLHRAGFTIRDYHPEKRVMSLPDVFMHSSNIGTALMGEALGDQNLRAAYKKLGLFDKSPIELKEKGSPMYPTPWRPINTLTASYGHGIAISPLQAVSALSTIANDGVYRPITMIKKDPAKTDNTAYERVFSEKTVHIMRDMLRLVVTHGTGKNANLAGFSVGGKTGTAEKPGPNGGYQKDKLISSFAGVFPTYDPRYAVFVMVDEPKGIPETYGYATAGWVAAPIMRNVVSSLASFLPEQEIASIRKAHNEMESLKAKLANEITKGEITKGSPVVENTTNQAIENVENPLLRYVHIQE
jgi:cell division protein FtsI (penicillin-binding protein 3)